MKTLRQIREHGETLPRLGPTGKASVETAYAAKRTKPWQHRPSWTLALCAAAFVTGCSRNAELSSFTQLLAHHSATSPDAPSSGSGQEELALNHVQLKGSHNSYHQAPRMAVVKAWRYSHLPLDKQLDVQGVRQIELDVRYSGGEVVVGHLPVLDGRSSCRTLKACLKQIKGWSSEHPAHLPIFVFIEPKEDVSPSNLQGRMEVLDSAISSVFSRKSLIVPEDIVGNASSLQEAVQTRGWPSLETSRGKVVFVLFGRKNHTRSYARGRPRLEGRLMFATGNPGDPYAAVASYDDPVAMRGEIAEAVRQRMLVRTRADGNLRKDVRRRDAALESGAHFIGSDFVDPKLGWLELGPRTPARCNPKAEHTNCVSAALREEVPSMVALEQHIEVPNPTGLETTPAHEAEALDGKAHLETALPSIEAMP